MCDKREQVPKEKDPSVNLRGERGTKQTERIVAEEEGVIGVKKILNLHSVAVSDT